MKKIGLVVSLFACFFSYGQKSIYFSVSLPPESDSIGQVDEKYYGSYSSDDGSLTYQIDETGIYVVSLNVSSIPKELVRESSKYTVRNGYLFGVIENDSTPYVLEEGRYYFGIRNKMALIGEGSTNVLKELNTSEYVINIEEGANYSPVRVKFDKRSLSLSYFDYESDTKEFDFIKSQRKIKAQYFELILLKPIQAEFKQLLKMNPFPEIVKFKKED